MHRVCAETKQCRPNGYTFIELTVVMVIILSVAAVGVPRLVSWVNDENLGAESRRLAGLIRYIRNEAARRQTRFYLTIDIEGNAYWVDARRDPSEIERPSYYVSWEDPEDLEFEPYEDEYVTRRELRRRIVFDRVLSDDAQEEHYGKVRIEFRPDGTTEDVAIYLRNTQERVATLVLDGDTGAVEIFDYLFEPEPKPTLYEQYDLDE
jgi:prepilin-type N-terminal cleavage/methylation domain-containing protein